MLPLFDQVYNKFRDGFLRGTVVLLLILVTLSHLGAWGAANGSSCGKNLADRREEEIDAALESLRLRMNAGQKILNRGQTSPMTAQAIWHAANRVLELRGHNPRRDPPMEIDDAQSLANQLDPEGTIDRSLPSVESRSQRPRWEIELTQLFPGQKGPTSRMLFEAKSPGRNPVQKLTERAVFRVTLVSYEENFTLYGALYYLQISSQVPRKMLSRSGPLTIELIGEHGAKYPKQQLQIGKDQLFENLQSIAADETPGQEIPVIMITDDPGRLWNSASASQFLEAAIRQSLQNSP